MAAAAVVVVVVELIIGCQEWMVWFDIEPFKIINDYIFVSIFLCVFNSFSIWDSTPRSSLMKFFACHIPYSQYNKVKYFNSIILTRSLSLFLAFHGDWFAILAARWIQKKKRTKTINPQMVHLSARRDSGKTPAAQRKKTKWNVNGEE